MNQEVVSEVHPIIAKKINKSLKHSIVEGNFAAGSFSFGNSYFSPYALALGASAGQIGIMTSLINFLPSVIQLSTARLIEKFSRKKIVVCSILLQTFMFLAIIGAGIMFYYNVANVVWWLVGFITLSYSFGAVAHPAWFSWMGSLVPESKRGKYFAKRNRVTGFCGLVAMVIGALILDQFKTIGYVLIGFGILFSLAFIFRMISVMMFSKQYEPHLKIRKKDYFSFWSFLKKIRKTPFGRFTIFTAVLRVSINIAAPFVAVYMLRDLGFSYVWFMIITISATIFHLLFLPIIGKVSDRFGNIKLLKISCISFSVGILSWTLYPLIQSPFYLIFVSQLLAGIGWAGFGIATNNYIYDSVSQGKRGCGIAYFNLFSGIGMFIGAMIGSLLTLLNINFMNMMLFIFLISGFLRLLVIFVGRKSLREVRHVKKFSWNFVIKEFHPAEGLIRETHKSKHFKSRGIH